MNSILPTSPSTQNPNPNPNTSAILDVSRSWEDADSEDDSTEDEESHLSLTLSSFLGLPRRLLTMVENEGSKADRGRIREEPIIHASTALSDPVREQQVPPNTVGDGRGKEIVIYNMFEVLMDNGDGAKCSMKDPKQSSPQASPWGLNVVAHMSEVCGASGVIQSVIEDFQGFLIDTDKWPFAFYVSLMTRTSDHSPLILKVNSLDNHANHIVTVEKAQRLLRLVTKEDIKLVIFDIAEYKSLGPDGYSSSFYKAAWPVIGEEVTKAIMEFFSTGLLLRQLNATLLALIPKVQYPSTVSEFRPISCCNVLYKVITKILVQRIKEVLDKIITLSQNAFVPGRLIANNILLAHELCMGYNQKHLLRRCALNVDLRKAYDMVEWDFLIVVMHPFGFPQLFIHWIKESVTTPTFSVCLNSAAHGFFAGARGLRQGDPMSPYLFILIIELCFADDLLLLCEANEQSISLFKRGLEMFASLVGLHAMASILPKGVIRKIEQRLRSFLWKGASGDRYPKVAWNQVCQLIKEGGQGIRDILVVNLALMSRHLWRITQGNSDSIWVNWIYHVQLQGKSIWTVNDRTGSCGWVSFFNYFKYYTHGSFIK
ncbi:UNVERIFIED_CONTAM: Retrovirus-related Pol polyprotein from type-2 retrotransposable element R2DM [Sesamum calycinum]|uniref:Retrovirus-related Pol polyprotein from type-2 retrotransposable element R2DM n=1 Tax=Sesamum calycinum TaxID=2727403 RepID=A0AAW2PAA8_9LAMI